MRYCDKHAIVTGGLGFIGSNLALRLIEEGARVTVLDSAIPGCGSNRFNLQPAGGHINVVIRDISQVDQLPGLLASAHVVFNLAGEIGHLRSMRDPIRDLKLNASAQLQFLESCVRHAPGVRVVYASTRQIYGVPRYLPIDELHPIDPIDFNGVHKAAADLYHSLYSRAGSLDACVIRLTNVYGPRMALNVPGQGFLSHYFRCLLAGEDLEVFGDGFQLRDPVYVDDAVEAFLLAGAVPLLPERVFNLGGPETMGIGEIAEIAAAKTGAQVTFKSFPAELKPIDIGSYHADYSRISASLGWMPNVRFSEGVEKTLAYFRLNPSYYLDSKEMRGSAPSR